MVLQMLKCLIEAVSRQICDLLMPDETSQGEVELYQ